MNAEARDKLTPSQQQDLLKELSGPPAVSGISCLSQKVKGSIVYSLATDQIEKVRIPLLDTMEKK